MRPIYIYCDGGCRGNQYDENLGAYAGYIVNGGEISTFGGVESCTANNRMELLACITGLNQVLGSERPVVVVSDSAYLIKGITEWVPGWSKNGWVVASGGGVKNRDLWERLWSLKMQFKNIRFVHCRRGSNPGNIQADLLVNETLDDYLASRKLRV